MDHPSQMFNCDYCNYVSTYKGNVVRTPFYCCQTKELTIVFSLQLRHMKLMHPHVAINSPSISPDTRDQDVTSNPTTNQHSNSDVSNGEAAR